MSVLDKLKDLVASLEEGERSTAQKDAMVNASPPAPPREEDLPEIEAVEAEDLDESSSIEELPDYLDCTAEESKVIFESLAAVRRAKISLSESLIRFEETKRQIFAFIEKSNKELIAELNSLRLEYGIPEEGYSVQLPTSESDKVSFSKD